MYKSESKNEITVRFKCKVPVHIIFDFLYEPYAVYHIREFSGLSVHDHRRRQLRSFFFYITEY